MRVTEFILLGTRFLLAAVFLLAGATKLVDPMGLRKALRDFGLPAALARPMVVLLPALELAVAAALIPMSLAWYGAWGALALLIGFLIVVGIAMVRGRKPDCHCFGQLHSAPVGWSTLMRNGVLVAGAGWLVGRGRGHSGPDLWAWFGTLDLVERKVALVAACAMGFVFFRLLDRARPKREPVEDYESAGVEDEDIEEQWPAPAPAPAERPSRAPVEQPAPASSSAMGIGLPMGTPAPEFELPALSGEKHSLQSLREQGRDVLLVFSSPYCEPCQVVASNLVRWTREMEGLPKIVLVSRGAAQENLAKLKGFEASRVLLQRDSEVAEAYDCNVTPTGVLVGADGLIRSDLAVGGMAIKQLLSSCGKRGNAEAAKQVAQ